MANFVASLTNKEQVAEGTWAFHFEKPADFSYQAGQYVALVLPRLVGPDKRGPVRSLSISSAPCESDLLFTVRDTGSGFKKTLISLEPGEKVQMTKAIGDFTLAHASDGKPIIFLVGGIGITPVRSILKQAEHDGEKRKFVLFYSNRTKKDAAFDAELRSLRLADYTYVTTFSQETEPSALANEERGYITADMLKKYCPGADMCDQWYYLVGAPAFIEAMEKTLAETLGVAKERMVNDPFTGLVSARFEKK